MPATENSVPGEGLFCSSTVKNPKPTQMSMDLKNLSAPDTQALQESVHSKDCFTDCPRTHVPHSKTWSIVNKILGTTSSQDMDIWKRNKRLNYLSLIFP